MTATLTKKTTTKTKTNAAGLRRPGTLPSKARRSINGSQTKVARAPVGAASATRTNGTADRTPSGTRPEVARRATKHEGGGHPVEDTQPHSAAPLANKSPAGRPGGATRCEPAGRGDISGAGLGCSDTLHRPARPARTTTGRSTSSQTPGDTEASRSRMKTTSAVRLPVTPRGEAGVVTDQRGAGQCLADTLGEGARPARITGRKGQSLPGTRGPTALPATNNDDAGHPFEATLPAAAGVVTNQGGGGRQVDDARTVQASPAADQPPAGGGPPSGWPGSADEDPVVAAIRHQYRFRCGAMLGVNRLEAQCKAYVRTALGFSTLLPEADRERIAADATRLVDAIAKGGEVPPALAEEAAAVRAFVLLVRESTAPLKRSKAGAEKELARLVQELPVWDAWAKGVKGLSEMGVATFVGECGDLLTYANPGKVWARLGLAPKDYYRRTTVEKGEPKTYHAIPKVRRSRSWSITDILLRQAGPYQDVYRTRRRIEVMNHPEWDKGVSKTTGRPQVAKPADMRARRYAEKRLVRDLWKAWHRAAGVEPAVPPHELDRTAAA